MKKYLSNTHFHLTLTFQSTIRFHLYREKSANPPDSRDSSEKPMHPAQVCLPHGAEPVYEDPQ